jgi:catechol 2,3-dioxygenase-like lactoylglutathione lyase family enzyme
MGPLAIDEQITFCYVRDLAETSRFYEKTLGLPLALDQGDCRIYQVTAAAFVGFCERKWAAPGAAGVILTLVVQDVDAWYAHLQAHGVVFEAPPALNSRYGIYHVFLRDPDGYLIEIQHFQDPDWAGRGSSDRGNRENERGGSADGS